MKKVVNEDLLRDALALLLKIERNKDLYRRLDDMIVKLKDSGFTTALVKRHMITLVDNFADDKNVSWKATAMRRYDLKLGAHAKRTMLMVKKRK